VATVLVVAAVTVFGGDSGTMTVETVVSGGIGDSIGGNMVTVVTVVTAVTV
jgi:hypothetical protein